jgi:hypothetical protein
MKGVSAICIVFLVLLSWHKTAAQRRYALKEADQYYCNYHYALAIQRYEPWIKSHPGDIEVKKRLANCYVKLGDSENAERLYGELVSADAVDNTAILNYAEMLAMNGKYDKASQYYWIFEQRGGDTRGKRFAEALRDPSVFFRDSARVGIRTLSINSDMQDFGPAFYKNGLVFCSARMHTRDLAFDADDEPYLDLYFIPDTAAINAASSITKAITQRAQSIAGKDAYFGHSRLFPQSFHESINSKYHEGPLVFFKGENLLVFTRSNYDKGKYRTDDSGTNRLKLFFAVRQGNSWITKAFEYNNDAYSVGHPALNRENTVLYFASDMPGGKGGSDIWYCMLEDGRWSKPVNLESVNTEGHELFPFVDAHGNLFFASNGWAGLGGLDIFYSRWQGAFGTPENVGYPINSMKDDFGLILSGDDRSGYFASARNGDRTGDDIYYFKSDHSIVHPYGGPAFTILPPFSTLR